jgi:hypothetical protein
MFPSERIRNWARPIAYLGRNPLSFVGAMLTTSSALTMIAFWFYDLFLPGPVHPYIGILLFLILPAVFVVGLLLIPVGMLLRRRTLRAQGWVPSDVPKLSWREPLQRNALLLLGFATLLNLMIFGTASYRGVGYMDSVQFCGQTCHTVMEPEYTAYQHSPHQRVPCVDCHIGAGASWFVRSKLSGVRQVFAVTFHTYSRPIPSPVRFLRPARETCEQCHWPQRFSGDKFFVRTKYQEDEKNTPLTTILVVKVGGRTWQGGVGIHGRHLDDASRIRYVAIDAQREVIPVVYYTDDAGKVVKYVSSDIQATPEQLARGEERTMDCIDCHNRPSHSFEMPVNAVDDSISTGHISADLPFIRKKAVELLKAEYPDRETARQRIVSAINDFYQTGYPAVYSAHRALVQQAGDQVAAIYLRNIFPDMRLTWGAHPNNIGHDQSPGCFRCHDGSHTSADGRVITNDCSACHTLLAVEEKNPKILSDLQIK